MSSFGSSSYCTLAFVVLVTLAVTFEPIQTFSIGSENLNTFYNSNFEDKTENLICAKSCNKNTNINYKSDSYINYETGKTYTYQIDLTTSLKKSQSSEQQNKVQIKALADLSIYNQCDGVIRIRQTQIHGLDEQTKQQLIKQLENESTHFSIQNGKIEYVCAEINENEWTLNIKKSILSAIQMSANDLKQKQTIVETDINGQCETVYQPINQWKYGSDYSNKKTATVVLKTKELAKCNKRHQINMGLFPKSYGLDQLVRSSMPLINATYECQQRIENGVIVDSKCCDKQSIWPLKITIDSDIHLKLIDEQNKLSVQKSKSNNKFSRQNLAWSSTYDITKRDQQQYTVQDVQQLLQKICQQVQRSIEIDVPQMFAQLLQAKRWLSVQDEQQIWQQIQSGSICQSPKINDIYLDASALAGTEGSIEVLIQAYQQYYQQQGQSSQQEQQPQILPRFSYLFSLLAFTKVPTIEAAKRLTQFVQQQQDFQQYQLPEYDQIVFGVSGFIYNIRQYQQQQGQQQGVDSEPKIDINERDLDQLVVQIQQHQIGQLEQCLQQISPDSQTVNVTTCLTWVNAIDNVGIQIPSQNQQQQDLVQRLVQIVQNLQSTPEYVPIRVAIIRSMIDAIPEDQRARQYLLQQVFKQEQEPLVVRVEAYKTLVLSSPKISELEQIHQYVQQINGQQQQNSNKDLVQYVRSHQANLRTTSDLYRRSILPLGAPEFEKPLVGAFDMSRNYELSYLNDVYQMGVTAEVDVIYGDSKDTSSKSSPFTIPQAFQFNLTVPVMGREFQAVQIRVEQTGLDKIVSQKIQQLSQVHEQTKMMDPILIIKQLIEVTSKQGQQMLEQNPEFRLYVQVSIDGKTVMVLDQKDLVQFVQGGFNQGQFGQFIQDLFNGQQRQQVSIDRAFAMVPIDFVAGMTTTNGFPVQVQVNSSIVFGLKSDIQVQMGQGQNSVVELAVWPSIAGEVEARVQYSTGNHVKAIAHRAKVYSAPHLNLMAQLKSQEGLMFKWNMPEQKYTFFRLETGLYTTEPNRQVTYYESSPRYHQKQCTDFTKKPFGVAFCYDVKYDNQAEKSEFVTEVTLEKFDQQVQSFEIYLDNPVSYLRWIVSGDKSSEQQKRSLKFVFNTPGSRINRELAFELELPTLNFESGLLKEARLRLQTPWKQVVAQAIARNQQNERIVNLELSIDQQKLVAMELSLQAVQQRGPKSEYQAKMILSTPFNRRPINLMGVWSSQQGSKAQWHLALEDVEQKLHYIQATVVKTGNLVEGDFKCSAHCMINLAGVSAKTTGTFVRSERDLQLDFNTDYDLFSSGRTDSVQLLVSHQNMAQESNQMIKLLQKARWSCTQFPKYNMEYSHHLTLDPQYRYYEHDLKLGWNKDTEQVRCYNMAKMQSTSRQQPTDQYEIDAESILVVRPLKIDYQVKAQSSLVGVEALNGIKSYRLIAEGHKRDQPEVDKVSAHLMYEQKSESPLKMKMLASVKSDMIDFIYSDDIQEQQPNEYNGHMLIQLTPQRKYSADYVYSIKNDKEQQQHNIDVTLNDAITNQLKAKQQAQVQFVSNHALNVKSKWTDEHDQNVFDGELSWNRYGPSKCQFTHYPTDTEADVYVDIYGQPILGKIQLKAADLKHNSEIKYEKDRKFLKLNSQTKKQEKNLLSIDSEISPSHASHLNIDSDYGFNTHCKYDNTNNEKDMAQFSFRLPSEWTHETKMFVFPNNERFEINSETNYQNKNMANIDGAFDKQKEFYYLFINTPKGESKISTDNKMKRYDVSFKNDEYDHKTHLHCHDAHDEAKKIDFETKTIKNGNNIATIKYDCDDDDVHHVKVDCDDIVRANAQCQWKQTDEPYANVNVDWLNNKSPFKHETTIFGNKKDNSWKLDSKTKMSDDKIAKIRAAIAKKSSDLVIDLPQFKTDMSYDNDEEQSQKHQFNFNFDGKTYAQDFKHQTQIKIEKRSIIDLKSETKSKSDNKNYLKIDGQYRHNDKDKSSNLNVNVGQFLQTMSNFNLFNDNEKQFHISSDYKDDLSGEKYYHETQAKYWPKENAMKIDSKINDLVNNKNIATIKSFITKNADKTSYFETESEDTEKFPKTKIEISPRMKRAAIDFEMNPIQHQTVFQSDNSAVKLHTSTLKNQQNIFNFNSELNRDPTTRSHVKVQVGPKYQTSFQVYPQKRSGSFSFETPTIRHGTDMTWNPNMGYGQPSTIQSTTHYRDDMLADIDARLEGLRGENVIKANVPSWIRLDSTMDIPGHRLSFDAQSDRFARHAMGSIYASPLRRDVSTGAEGREFHFDFAWDVDRDPRSRVLVDVSAKRQQDQTIVVVGDIDYAHNKFTVQGELTPGNFLANWARVSVGYTPYTNLGAWQVIYTHSNHLPQVECKLELLTNGQVRYTVRVTSQLTSERFVFGFETTSPQNIDSQINVNVMGVDQGQGQYYLKVNVQRAVEAQYELEATAQQDSEYSIYVGKVELRFPKTETQTFEYRVDLPGRHIELQMVAPQNGKQFRLIGDIQDRLAQLLVKSDLVYLPKIDGKIKFVPGEEYYASFDWDNERLFMAQYKQTGLNQISSGQMYVLAKYQSVWTPTYEFTVQSSIETTGPKQNGGNLVITLEGKYNAEKILYGQMKRMQQYVDTVAKQSLTFEVNGWISRPNGVRLLEVVSQFVVGSGQDDQDLIQYVLDIVPNRQAWTETVEPIYVVVSAQRKPGESQKLVASVKVSHGQERRDWIDADLVVENWNTIIYQIPFPERIAATVRYVPTSTQATLAISFMELLDESISNTYGRTKTLFDDQDVVPQLKNLRVLRKYRNQILATLDDRKIGFELLTNQMGHRNTYEHSLKLYSPKRNGRQIHYRTAYHVSPESLTYFYRTELKSGFEQEAPIYQSTHVFAPVPEKPTSYMFYYDLQSPIMMVGDGHVWARAFFFGPENKYQGIVATVKTTSQDQITFEATTKTEEEQSNQMVYYGQSNKKTYFNVTFYTADGRINTGVDGHVAGYGAHFNWYHQTRHQQRKTGTYRFELVGQNQFEVVVEQDHHGYEAKGKLVTDKPGVWIVDALVEEYHKVLPQSYLNGGYYYSRPRQQQQQPQQRQTQNQYKVHVEAKDQCVRAEVEDQQQPENIQQLSYCMSVDQSNILNLAVDSITNGHKTTDLNIRLDTREVVNSVILSLKWNPSYQRTLLARFADSFTSLYNPNELVEELKYFVTVMQEKLIGHRQSGVQVPYGFNQYQAFVDELVQIAEDFGIDVEEVKRIVRQVVLKPIVYGIEDLVKVVYDYISVVDELTHWVQRVTRSVQDQCYNSDVCRQLVHSFVSIDSFEQLIENISEHLVEGLKHTHRIISSSYSGRWIRSLIPATVMDYVPEILHQVNHYFVNWYTKMVSGNYPLAELMNNFEHILHQMIVATQWHQVDWNQVKMASDKIVQLTLMPWRFTTTSRVLIYDPQQGQLQVELYGPVVKHARYYQNKYNDIFLNKQLSNSNSSFGSSYFFPTSNQHHLASTGSSSSSIWSKLFTSTIY